MPNPKEFLICNQILAITKQGTDSTDKSNKKKGHSRTDCSKNIISSTSIRNSLLPSETANSDPFKADNDKCSFGSQF